MKPLRLSLTWNRCVAASLAINGLAIGALGTGHLVAPASAKGEKVAKAEAKPPTRLMEIRMEKAPPEMGATPQSKKESGGESGSDGSDEEGGEVSTAGRTSPGGTKSGKTRPALGRGNRGGGGRTTGSGGTAKTPPSGNFGHKTLTPPKPHVVPRMSGVVDLRNVHLKGTTSADPKLLAKHQPPNRILGKSEVKVIGKATSLPACVGAVGGNTIMGGKMTVLLGKGIDIKGTKYCAPGGVPGIPGGGASNGQASQGQRANGASRGTATLAGTPRSSGTALKGGGEGKGAGAVDYREGRIADKVAFGPARANGPVRNLDDRPWISYGHRSGGKRMGGPETDLHLPAAPSDPTEREHPVSSPTSGAQGKGFTVRGARSPFEPAPLSVGSHSEQGTIPWGPDSAKRRRHGLKGDYYLGNQFESYRFTRVDPNIDFIWTNQVVDPRMPTRQPFSVRWTGTIKPDFSETYTIYTSSDDGVRLWIDGRLVIDNWTEHAPQEDVVRVPLQGGREVPIRLEYFEVDGLQIQVIKLYWESPSQPKVYIPTRSLFPPKPSG